jgi:hydroxymethylpyrimidine kinase/phosphomethylpyrimidine kinase
MIKNVLSIAGSDPSGGAGLQADLKTFGALGCYGMAVVTALTAQNTRGVSAVFVPPTDIVVQQIAAIFEDIEVAAIKIGLLPSAEIVKVVALELARHKLVCPIILDPVLVATSGDALSQDNVPGALIKHLFALATLITPNVPEAACLTGAPLPADISGLRALAPKLLSQGARAVLLKGGDLESETADDLLCDAAGERLFSTPRVQIGKTHGTGCTLSSAIAASMAMGLGLGDAIAAAKTYLTSALQAASTLNVGHGAKPLQHFPRKD